MVVEAPFHYCSLKDIVKLFNIKVLNLLVSKNSNK